MKRSFLSVRALSVTVGFAAAAVLFSACNKFDNDDNVNQDVAGLMAFNLSPDQPAVGFALSGNGLTNTPLGFNSYTGSYFPIYPGNRTVQSYVFGNSTILASADQLFEPNKYYSTFLVGADSNYRNVTVLDNFDSLSGDAGKAYIRYINAIPDSAAPTVVITAGGSDVVNESVAFASVGEFKEVPVGDVTIAIDNGSTISKNRTFAVGERKAYTALLIGIPGSSGADSVQLRYVENGTLTESGSQQRTSTSSRMSSGN